MILPREEGGLGIIDPEIQSLSMLIPKLIVLGLFQGKEPWKAFLCFAKLYSKKAR